MKKFIKSIFCSTSIILGRLCSIKLVRFLNVNKSLFYSELIKKEFKKTGNKFSIDYPYFVIGEKYISIGENFQSFPGLRLEAHDRHLNSVFTPEITIGNNVSFNFNCHIGCVNKIVIGNNVLLASRVFITDHFHGEITRAYMQIPPSERSIISKGPVYIGDNVWIGEGAAILPGVSIGENSIVGANAVIVKDVPPNSIVGGVPAKIIRQFN